MMAQEELASLEEASTEEVTQEQSVSHHRLLRGGVIAGLGVALVVLGLAGFHYRGQLSPAQVNAAQGKLGGQLMFHGDPQLCTGNMNSIVPYLQGTTNRARYIASSTGETYNVMGFVQVYSSVTSQLEDPNGEAYTQLFWNLYNVDPRCSPANIEISPLRDVIRQPASCGIKIHEAMSCSVPAGNPYWNEKKVPENVWLTSKYNSFQQYFDGIHGHNVAQDAPLNTAQGGITIQTGLGLQELQNHVLIVYDYDGLMIACGPLVTTGGTNPYMVDLTLAPTPAPR